ncbi:hypothetical protein PR003_g6839 [Phytophthora rubi]|uniref:Uncharacterized protein n=1 Tax=Phytophthora rubi TaxID=129364 RepID=A0A6A3N2C4_9STRA|nr:hypothetical protein PR002_g6362 [Phytophthora rubi]KAE9347621.1 hypothetical protein PR003_g6839 [Phytophthora rubi]
MLSRTGKLGNETLLGFANRALGDGGEAISMARRAKSRESFVARKHEKFFGTELSTANQYCEQHIGPLRLLTLPPVLKSRRDTRINSIWPGHWPSIAVETERISIGFKFQSVRVANCRKKFLG